MTTKTNDIRTAIRNADDNFEATHARGDAAGMADLYTEDGMLLPTGFDVVRDKPAIQQFWQGPMEMGIEEAELEIGSVETGPGYQKSRKCVMVSRVFIV